jgi:hypothetical protein
MKMMTEFRLFLNTAALGAGQLSEFGKFARWLFAFGMSEYLRHHNVAGYEAIQQTKEKARNLIIPQAMKQMKIPDWAFTTYQNSDMILARDIDKLNNIFNNYLKNLSAIPMDEKQVFQQAVFMVRYAQMGWPATRLDTIERYAKALSKNLGGYFMKYVRLKAGTDNEFSGKEQIDALYDELEGIVKRLTGKKGLKIPTDRQKELKLTNGEEVKDLVRYNDIRKELKNLTNSSVYSVISEKMLPADKVAKEMEKQGFRDFPFPTSAEGYTGNVGLNKEGKIALFTPTGREVVGGVAPGSKIKMNPKYNAEKDDTFYFMFRAPNAIGDTRAYTTVFKDIKTEAKHVKTTTNAGSVARWVKAWERDVVTKDPMRYVPAAVALILYLTSARVGSRKENQSIKSGVHTYGISTLRKQHVRIGSSSIIFDYVGKKGMHQKHTLKMDTKINKRIGVILKELLAGKKKDDLVFAFKRPLSKQGAIQEVNPAFFRAYLKSTGVTINPHALRHIRGTSVTEDLLNSKAWSPSAKARTLVAKQREAETYIKEEILTNVAKILGHKSMKNGVEVPAWRTSIQAYVNPKVISDWFKEQGLGVPKWVPSKLSDD